MESTIAQYLSAWCGRVLPGRSARTGAERDNAGGGRANSDLAGWSGAHGGAGGRNAKANSEAPWEGELVDERVPKEALAWGLLRADTRVWAHAQVGETAVEQYNSKTPRSIMALDCVALASAASALVHAVYIAIVGSFPFNAFLSAFLCSAGVAVSTFCLRMQTHPSETEFRSISRERAAAEYLTWNSLLILTSFNFIG